MSHRSRLYRVLPADWGWESIRPMDGKHIHNLLIPPHNQTIDWNAVSERARSHPEELRQCKDALLRAVARDPPVDALRTIIRADPEALDYQYFVELEGRCMNAFPLELACKVGVSVTRTILQEIVTPKGRSGKILQKRKRQSANIFYRTGIERHGFPIPLLRVFLEELPASFFLEENLAYHIVMNSTQSVDCWERLNLVLMAITMGITNENELNGKRFLVLHAFLALICGTGMFEGHGRDVAVGTSDFADTVFEVIKTREPEQFFSRDDDGSLPLHIVLHSSSKCDTEGLVKFLIEEHPESIRLPDGQGRLPLHLSVEHGSPTYRMLSEMDPTAVETPCPVTGLYPFQLAAPMFARRLALIETERKSRRRFFDDTHYEKCATTETIASVDITFNLLRMSPHVMNNLIAGTTAQQPWIHSEVYKKIQRNKLQIAQIEHESYMLERELKRFKES